MSDFAQTASYDRLPQRMAARMERSSFTCSMSASSASVNFCWIAPVPMRDYRISGYHLNLRSKLLSLLHADLHLGRTIHLMSRMMVHFPQIQETWGDERQIPQY